MNEKHVCYLQQCDVTAKLSVAADRGIVQLVVHMHQSSHSSGVPPGLTEVTKGLQIHNMHIGCTLVSKQSATQKTKKICASRSCLMTCLASVLV